MNRIRTLRQQREITQDELGNIVNVQKSAISKYELGRAVPSTDVLKKLSDYFNVSIDYLLGLSEERTTVTTILSPLEVGNEVQTILAERGLTPTDIDNQAGIKAGTTAKIIKGKYTPHFDIATKIATILDIAPSLLLAVREDKQTIQKQRLIGKLYEAIPDFCPTDAEIQEIIKYTRFLISQRS